MKIGGSSLETQLYAGLRGIRILRKAFPIEPLCAFLKSNWVTEINGVQQSASCKHSVIKNTLSLLAPASAGPDQQAVPGTAVVTRKVSVSVVAGGEMISRPVTETLEGPGALCLSLAEERQYE